MEIDNCGICFEKYSDTKPKTPLHKYMKLVDDFRYVNNFHYACFDCVTRTKNINICPFCRQDTIIKLGNTENDEDVEQNNFNSGFNRNYIVNIREYITMLLRENSVVTNGILDRNYLLMKYPNLSRLKEIDLSFNSIEEILPITFKKLFWLKKLSLNNNKIKEIQNDTFDDLSFLQILDLTDNQITDLNPEIFKNLRWLKEIDLSDNNLTSLNPRIFTNLKSLEIIYLYNNDIQNINQIETMFPNLSIIY